MLMNLSMLKPGGTETRENIFSLLGTDQVGYIQALPKKTVKELLMMKRYFSEKKWNGPPENSDAERKFKLPRHETFSSDTSPCPEGTPPPVNQNITSLFPATAHVNTYITPQPMAPTPEVKMTLFHWQIQQETKRIEGVSPELLNMQDADGDTILHIAVAQGKRALAYVLAANMAMCGSLDVKERNGQTALQIAAATNQHLIVQDLLTYGAQINTQDFWGRSPLHVCAAKGHFLTLQSIWRTLEGSGQSIDIEMFNYDGLTPLHAAVLSHNAVVKESRNLEKPCSYMAKELAQKGLMYVECIKTLLLMGASYRTRDLKSGRTCLHMASEEANVDLFKIFLDQSPSLSIINLKTFSGNTALHIVSSLQNHKTQVDAVKLLMRKGADPGIRNFENELPSLLVPEGPMGDKVRQILKGKSVDA
ncbi:NF-kappa-B inhibitor zeta isoform X2 [Mastacembelus armatus]|uniref:NF-kappa-B inhibitor zeta isoform X2 n=1 Tax=Mastacembelus armatus TaxID=205130 RepID=UPI000E460009|nr:NF-kappa-B inhibitor zeta-like isoform X2 [Mastacembelus armatus]